VPKNNDKPEERYLSERPLPKTFADNDRRKNCMLQTGCVKTYNKPFNALLPPELPRL
jgi:hypothetical protein